MMSNKAVKKMQLPMAPIARIIKNAGAEKVSEEANHELVRLLEGYGEKLAKRAVTLAEYSGREIVTAEDITGAVDVQLKPLDEVAENLHSNEIMLKTLISKIEKDLEQTDKNLVLSNLVTRTTLEIHRLRNWLKEPIEMLAWCARNLFELNLVVRFVLQSEDHFKHLLGQRVNDEIQILEGYLTLADNTADNTTDKRPIEKQLDDLKNIASEHQIDLKRPFNIHDLASSNGVDYEYKAFFKLYSKYVHPSSWLVNGRKGDVDRWMFRETFINQAQIYAGDTYSRIAEELGFDEVG